MDYKITDTTLTAIANKIRDKAGSSSLITPVDMPTELNTIPSVADYQNALDQMVEETATGPIASFTDGANNIPAKEIICHINPTETGTGEKSPQNPYVIGGHMGINVYQRATNLWDEQWEEGAYNSNNGNKINYNNRIRSKNFIPVAPNSQYFVSKANWGVISIYRYDKNKNYLGTTNVINSVFTTSSDCYFVNFNTGANSGSTYTNDISINYPSTVRGYYAYIGDTVNVLFGQNVYGGEFDVVNGVIHCTWNKKTVSELSFTVQSGNRFTARINDCVSVPNFTGFLCSSYKVILVNANYNTWMSNQVITIVDNRYTTATEFKEAMGDTQIVYPLAEPFDIQLTPQEIKTLLGANNIYHDCNGDIDVTYRANGALYVQEHPITRGLMAARPTEQIQEQEEQQEES